MTDAASRKLIEEILPLEAIGIESSKSVSYGAIHAIHTWFARRPLAACRAAVFGALVDAPNTEAARQQIVDLLASAAPNKAVRENAALVNELRRHVREAYGDRPPRLLDPFGGGGSIPLEAARLGCEVETLDVNPVAVLTMLATVDYPIRFSGTEFPLPAQHNEHTLLPDEGDRTGGLVEAVKAWGDWLLAWVRPRLADFYPLDEDGAVPVAYLWAKTVPCTNPACGSEIPLVAHRWLSRRKNHPRVAYALEHVGGGRLEVHIVEGDAADACDPSQGTTSRGAARCPCCGQGLKPDQVKAAFRRKGDGRMLLIVALKDPGETGTRFRAATDRDRAAYRAAADALADEVAAHDDPFFSLVPDEPMPDSHALGIRPILYGVKTWGEMHNDRQSLSLVTFCRGVTAVHDALRQAGAAPDEAAAVALYQALTVSKMVLRMSEGSRWNNKRDTVEAATAGHRLPMLWDYAAANPLSGGSGSWETTLRWMLPALKNVEAADGLPAHVAWGDARKLPFEDNEFDVIVTDPPYYDSVPYAYLSDMQYVWLHRALGTIMPDQFPTSLTPKSAELVHDRARHKSDAEAKQFYEDGMVEALSELHRVVKPEGLAVVMFAHSETEAWETLVSALIRSGFQITASWPVDTETASRRDWLGGAMLAATIFLACRPRHGQSVGYLRDVAPAMEHAVAQALDRFWAAGIGGADFFVSAIGPALSVYSRYAEVRFESGQPVPVSAFLTLVRQAVVDHSLRVALKGVELGSVDAVTQFALLWRWTYRNQAVESGAALLLDKATGVELDELERKGLLARSNGSKKFVLLGPRQRADQTDTLLRRSMAGGAALVDSIHAGALLWESGRRDELNDLLASLPDTARQVAQALAELQAEGAEERRLLTGLIGAWPKHLVRTDDSSQDSVQGTLISD